MASGYINSQSIFATAFNCQAISTSDARDVFGLLASPSDKVTDRPSVSVFSRLV
jgi:hypothetical protein